MKKTESDNFFNFKRYDLFYFSKKLQKPDNALLIMSLNKMNVKINVTMEICYTKVAINISSKCMNLHMSTQDRHPYKCPTT